MEYHVWLPGATDYVVCESQSSMLYLVSSANGPVRVEIWSHALSGIETYGLQGGPSLPKTPTGKFQQMAINHVRQL